MTDSRMPPRGRAGPKRGAIPSPRHLLAAARPYTLEEDLAIKRPKPKAAPPELIRIPKQISMWGNYFNGDCVTAEEAFAKACDQIAITDDTVIAWATQHNALNGANIHEVMVWMQTGGFQQGGHTYDDGAQILSVDWTNANILKQALFEGPIKIGVSGDQLDATWNAAGGTEHGGKNWIATGYHKDPNVDHCVSLCGYGSIGWLAQQLDVVVPSGVNAGEPGYALFTWDSIGVIDVASMLAITEEAWLRMPTTVTH